jgi:hypothetical protein
LHNPTTDYANGFTLALGTRDGGRLEPVVAPDENPTQDGRIAAVSHIASRFLDAALGGTSVTPGLREGLRVQRLLDLTRTADRVGGWHAAPAP